MAEGRAAVLAAAEYTRSQTWTSAPRTTSGGGTYGLALQEHRLGRRQLATTAAPIAEIQEAVVEYRHAVAHVVGGVVVVVGVVHHTVVAVGVVMVVVVVYREGGGGRRQGRR